MKAKFDVELEEDISWPDDDAVDRYSYDDSLRDIDCGLLSLAIDKLDELLYKKNIDYLEYDIDFDYRSSSGITYVEFDEKVEDKNKVKAVLEEFQDIMEKLSYTDTFTAWGRYLYGGYPSYDPPEYDDYEVEVTVSFYITSNIEFE